jgi:hypothetical protein
MHIPSSTTPDAPDSLVSLDDNTWATYNWHLTVLIKASDLRYNSKTGKP